MKSKCSQMPKSSRFTKLDKTIANQNKKVYNTSMKNKGGIGKKYNDRYKCGCFFDNVLNVTIICR